MQCLFAVDLNGFVLRYDCSQILKQLWHCWCPELVSTVKPLLSYGNLTVSKWRSSAVMDF